MVTNGLNGQAERTRDSGPADNHDHCEPTHVYVGNEISNRPATPDEAARAAADANAVATQVESLCDQFGIPKPPEGKGVPAAPSPDFVTWDDRPVYRGVVLAPVTAPDSQWIAGEIVAGDLLELIGVDGKREIMLSREAFKSCWGYADRKAETRQDPEDIAQAIFLELDLAVKTEPTRRRLRSLVLKLLRSR